MTVEERHQQIGRVTAGIAEERRKDREEYGRARRQRRRELHALTLKIADTNEAITRLAEESRATNGLIERLAEESRDADNRLSERINALVSAIGQFLSRPGN